MKCLLAASPGCKAQGQDNYGKVTHPGQSNVRQQGQEGSQSRNKGLQTVDLSSSREGKHVIRHRRGNSCEYLQNHMTVWDGACKTLKACA